MAGFPLDEVKISDILSQILAYTITNDTYFEWIQLVNDIGLEMSLAKQYFDDWLVSITQQDHSFSRAEKNSNQSKYMKGFSITRGNNIFSIRSDTFLLKDFVNPNLKTILEDNVQSGACKVNLLLRNLGYNNISTQNQNIFPPTARNVLAV